MNKTYVQNVCSFMCERCVLFSYVKNVLLNICFRYVDILPVYRRIYSSKVLFFRTAVLRSFVCLFVCLFVYIFIYFVFVCQVFNVTLENSSSIWRRCWWKKHKQQENLIETGGESIMTIYPRQPFCHPLQDNPLEIGISPRVLYRAAAR